MKQSDKILYVGKPNIGDRQKFLRRAEDILDRRWLSNDGVYVQELERKLQTALNVEHVVAICNATTAIEIVIRALGLEGEVLVPSFTFIATAHALTWMGIKPVFCDIDADTHNIDPEKIEENITSRTAAIMAVNLWGRPCAIDELQDIAERNNLRLVFDSSHALGCTYQGKYIGNFGDAEVVSFHATKIINSFEGGAVLTNNRELAERLRKMRNFGFTDYDKVMSLGTNGKLDEMSAAMALTNMESFADFIGHNYRNYIQYKKELSNVTGIEIIPFDEKESNNYQYVVCIIREGMECRDYVMSVLHDSNILARRYFYPGCHLMEPYRSEPVSSNRRLPVTDKIASQVLCLPTGTDIDKHDIDRVCGVIKRALSDFHEKRSI